MVGADVHVPRMLLYKRLYRLMGTNAITVQTPTRWCCLPRFHGTVQFSGRGFRGGTYISSGIPNIAGSTSISIGGFGPTLSHPVGQARDVSLSIVLVPSLRYIRRRPDACECGLSPCHPGRQVSWGVLESSRSNHV